MLRTLLAATALLPCAAFAAPKSVVTYHNGNGRQGAYVVAGLTTKAAASLKPDTGFSAAVSGHIYAQPLFWQTAHGAGEIIAATESNIVYGLDAATGAVIWQTALASPAALKSLPCGNIDPEGIDGTPVIDIKTATLYLDALTQTGSTIRHLVYAISLKTGAVLSGWPIDVQALMAAQGISFSSANQGERSAAMLFGGNLYLVYGGKYGDCLPYNGTVLQINPATQTLAGVWQTRAAGGGIWAQGGIAVSGQNLFVTTGNTMGASSYGDGESIVRLKPGLARSTATADYYAPPDWQTLDNRDLDLGGTEALPVNVVTGNGGAVGRAIALGKDGKAYLVNRNNLGGIGGAATVVHVSNAEIITEPAIYSSPTMDMVAFTNLSPIGCTGAGIMMLKLAPSGNNAITTAWCAAYSGDGSPIITTTDGTSNPIVWVVGAQGDNQLHGFDALTGATLFNGSGTSMSGLHHFQTLIAANGRLYVAGDGKLYAFTFTPG